MKPLALKYRPQTVTDLVGQPIAVRILTNLFNSGMPQTMLFVGPRGCGKTTGARIVAAGLVCEVSPGPHPCGKCSSCKAVFSQSSLNVLELDCGSAGSVDSIRETIENTYHSGGIRIHILDECHLLSATAQAALLKSLEEPPTGVYWFLATTDPQKLSDALKSRAVEVRMRSLNSRDLSHFLKSVCEKESLAYTDESIAAIVRAAKGGVRDALSVLEQTKNITDPEFILDSLGIVPTKELHDFITSILAKDFSKSILQLKDLLESYEIGGIYDALVLGLSEINKLAHGLGPTTKTLSSINSHSIIELLTVLEKHDSSIRFSSHKTEWLELAIAIYCSGYAAQQTPQISQPKPTLFTLDAPTKPQAGTVDGLTIPANLVAFAAKCEIKRADGGYSISGPKTFVNMVKKGMQDTNWID